MAAGTAPAGVDRDRHAPAMSTPGGSDEPVGNRTGVAVVAFSSYSAPAHAPLYPEVRGVWRELLASTDR